MPAPETRRRACPRFGLPGPADAPKAAAAKPKVNFQDHVAAIFQSRCNSCHNADKAERRAGAGDLRRDDARGRLGQGGRAGRPRRQPPLAARHARRRAQDAAARPPRSPRRSWRSSSSGSRAGAPETSGSVVAIKEKPKFEFKLDPSSMGKPVGPPAMPEGVSTEPVVLSPGQRHRRDGRQPLGPPGRGRGSQAGLALSVRDEEPARRRLAVPRRDGPRPQVQPERARSCWPAAAEGGSRAWPWSSTSRRASGSSRSARNTTSSSPPTSAPITARSRSAGRARSSGSTTRPTASSSSR